MYKTIEAENRVREAAKRGNETSKANAEKRIKEYYNNPKRCLNCNKSIDYYKQVRTDFCGRSCSAKYRAKLDIRIGIQHPYSRGREKKICGNCHQEFLPERDKQNFCSCDCDKQVKRNIRITEIESDVIVGSSSLRNYLMNKYNEKCQTCGWGERNSTSQTVCLDMHHIDGNSKNSKLSNVQLLCPNCHSLTDNYKRVSKKT